jgi:hypothetical protein
MKIGMLLVHSTCYANAGRCQETMRLFNCRFTTDPQLTAQRKNRPTYNQWWNVTYNSKDAFMG